MIIRIGNSGSPRWYDAPDRGFEAYLDHLVEWGATSAEIVLHHGPYDERTARVHVLDPEWLSTVRTYQERGIAVQIHVSLDARFATARWSDDRQGLTSEFEPIIELAEEIAELQERLAVVIHGASDPQASVSQNEDTTAGLLDWLATAITTRTLPAFAALELGAFKPDRETAAARSRASVMSVVTKVDSDRAGICWDLAHDYENAANEPRWTVDPAEDFLRRVVHVHVHDVDDDGLAHYPLLLGSVPFREQLEALTRLGHLPSMTMEVRWLCASRLGDPWEMLGRSYEVAWRTLDGLTTSAERRPA